MGDRPYLSIGDVLALLQREFPDVTISKIRFLESRGLLVPERTPSGYRKFYEHDVERLKWILRQQREHFLPLKVIKGRLDGQEAAPPAALFQMGDEAPAPVVGHEEGRPNAQSRLAEREVQNGEAQPARASAAGEPAGADATSGTGGFVYTSARRARLDRSPTSSVLAANVPARAVSTGVGPDGSRQDLTSSPVTTSTRAALNSSEPQSAQGSGPQPSGPPEGAVEPARRGRSAPGAQSDRPGERGRPTASDKAATSRPLAASDPPAEASGAGAASPAVRPAPKSQAADSPMPEGGRVHSPADLVGASLTAGELAQASGLDVHQVEELEAYSLIEGRTVAGVRCYDEAALLVARLSASFARYGVEARHLRVFKYAAERQTGLYSQIVLPLLRQRNPSAHRRALDDLARLSELGASMQALFATAALRDLTGA